MSNEQPEATFEDLVGDTKTKLTAATYLGDFMQARRDGSLKGQLDVCRNLSKVKATIMLMSLANAVEQLFGLFVQQTESHFRCGHDTENVIDREHAWRQTMARMMEFCDQVPAGFMKEGTDG